MILYPEVQARAQEEIDRVVGTSPSSPLSKIVKRYHIYLQYVVRSYDGTHRHLSVSISSVMSTSCHH